MPLDNELALDMERLGYFAAEIIAETKAIELPAVREFRALLPGGRPLAINEVRTWINERKARRGEGLKRAVAQEIRGVASKRGLSTKLTPPSPTLETVWLEIVVVHREGFGRDRTRIAKVEFKKDTEAEALWAASDILHRKFGWQSGSAAGWLLCGTPPDPPAIRVTPQAASTIVEAPLWIPLSLIPRLIPAFELHDDLAKRGPRLSHKLLEVTSLSVRRNDGRTWAQVLDEWNGIAPTSWRYLGPDARRHFARDARDTYRKLMGEPLEWNRGGIVDAKT